MTRYARILVPTDFSPASEAALRTALDLAGPLDSDVHVVHVWQLPIYTVPDGYFVFGEAETTRLVEGLEQSLAKLVADHATREGITVRTRLAQGLPELEIHRLASEIDAGMIVMGTHGRRGLAHFFLGSVAEKVIRGSKVPVVVVPPRDAT